MEKDIKWALSCERIAEEFYFGRGRERDLEQAKTYFRKAAQYGVGEVRAEALCNLALLTEDPQIKVFLYMEAAEENCAHAMNMVGVCLERYGVGEGYAMDWYRRAAKAGSSCGLHNFSRWDRHRTAEDVRRGREKKEKEEAEAARSKAWLAACLEAAKAWVGEPAAIVYIPDISHDVLNALACDAAKELRQSVLLLTEIKWNKNNLKCAGYDFGNVGLAQAMNNPYQLEDCWGLGRFAIGRIRKEDRDIYCAAVERALKDRLP